MVKYGKDVKWAMVKHDEVQAVAFQTCTLVKMFDSCHFCFVFFHVNIILYTSQTHSCKVFFLFPKFDVVCSSHTPLPEHRKDFVLFAVSNHVFLKACF